MSGLGALIALIIVIAIAANAGGSKNTPSANTGATTAPSSTGGAAKKTSTAPTPGGKSLPIQNGDWKLISVRPKNDGLGDFEVETRVTYTGSDSNGGTNLFTLTVFKSGKEIASLNGSANSVSPGSTASVDFIGSDKFVAGPYTYDFQNDI